MCIRRMPIPIHPHMFHTLNICYFLTGNPVTQSPIPSLAHPLTHRLSGTCSIPRTDRDAPPPPNSNADITYRLRLASQALATILDIQPRSGGAAGGLTREEQAVATADDLLKKVPPAWSRGQVGARIWRSLPD